MSKTAVELRRSMQELVRAFGLLAGDQTPCGQPLPTSHAHALLVLLGRGAFDEASGLKQQELAEALGLDKSSVTRLCAKMIEAGHLRQSPSKDDGRAWVIALSARGRRAAEAVHDASHDRFRRLAAALPRTVSVEEAVRVLDALTAAARASTRPDGDAHITKEKT